MEIYTGIGVGLGHNVNFKLEIPEVVVFDRTYVEKMTSGAIDGYHTVTDTESVLVLVSFPAVK